AAGWHLLAMSPDGTKLAYVANSQLFVRDMSEADARPISGSYGRVTNPFFSPDAQWIGFWTAGDNLLKKIAITGGIPVTICKTAGALLGASWAGDQIVFGDGLKGIMRVSANGGEPEMLVSPLSPGELMHGPQVLDGSKAVLFTVGNLGG